LLRKTAREIARLTNGVVYDPQTAVVITPRRSISVKFDSGTAIDLIALSWWFLNGPLTTPAGLKGLLSYFENHIPQFLPKRYGPFEPPKYRFEWERLDHFVESIFNEKLPLFVWQTGGPFSVHYAPNWGPGWRWLGGSATTDTSCRIWN
jgi:hypothetical protein